MPEKHCSYLEQLSLLELILQDAHGINLLGQLGEIRAVLLLLQESVRVQQDLRLEVEDAPIRAQPAAILVPSNIGGWTIPCTSRQFNATECPRSGDPFCVVTYYIEWVTTS